MKDDDDRITHATQVKIDLDADTAQGAYSNLAMVNHTETEFTLDFVYIQPQEPKGTVRARVITAPKHAKWLAAALTEAIEKYEAAHGPIDSPQLTMPPNTILNLSVAAA